VKRVVILGAAGRDFHNFNMVFRDNPEFMVVAFTAATQIPGIDGRVYPRELAGGLYPDGIPILPETDLERVIRDRGVDVVVFAYSDLSHEGVMHLASRAVAAGADFWLLGTAQTQLISRLPVISVCAVRTGCGKSPVSRRVVENLRRLGWRPVVVRHPMPYGELPLQRAQRFASLEDLDRQQCTIEEREEYEPHIRQGTWSSRSGLPKSPPRREEGDVILWDGVTTTCPSSVRICGSRSPIPTARDTSFVTIPGSELSRRRRDPQQQADSAPQGAIAQIRANAARVNPRARVLVAASR
jgi:predicted GTPase